MQTFSKSTSLSYPETLEFLYHSLPMFEKLGPKAFKKDLANIIELCSILGNPQEKFRSIHIAGTNGKGSVSHMLSSILIEAGYKTGLYISPHYKDYRERIRINGTFISKKFIVEFVDKIRPHIDQIKPSFFEITVAMAFEYFAKQKVQIAIIETGLGGRLDSTNIITPLLSVITNISFDHQNMLGNTLIEIAGEKAGIIKPGIPCLLGEYQKETARVFIDKAKSLSIPIYFANKKSVTKRLSPVKFEYHKRGNKKQSLLLATNPMGPYQEKNINTAINAIEILNQISDFSISSSAIKSGLKNISKNAPLIGRWHILGTKPLILADAAHNLSGIRILFDAVKKLNVKKIHCVFGTVRDKDILPVLAILPKSIIYYFVKADLPRAMDENELMNKASEMGLSGKGFGSVKKGYREARSSAGKDDLVLIAGSIFVVGEII
ncbi:MAG: folylpolyglutamate synthase/dihydrofolate synthase family protein [Saprospiraceae bacterium]